MTGVSRGRSPYRTAIAHYCTPEHTIPLHTIARHCTSLHTFARHCTPFHTFAHFYTIPHRCTSLHYNVVQRCTLLHTHCSPLHVCDSTASLCFLLHVLAHHCTLLPLHSIARHCTLLHTTSVHRNPLHTIARHCTPLHTLAHLTLWQTIAHHCKPLHTLHDIAHHCTYVIPQQVCDSLLHVLAHHCTLLHVCDSNSKSVIGIARVSAPLNTIASHCTLCTTLLTVARL